MRSSGFLLPFCLLFLAACTSIENDPSTNYPLPLYETRIDFQPLTREELTNQLAYEEKIFSERSAPLKDQLGGVQAARRELYEKVEGEIADCRHQAHCVANMTRGSESKFLRSNEAAEGLKKLDREAGEIENRLSLLDRRRDLRERALQNRFLVGEILGAKQSHTRIQDILVHSLEAFPSRRAISERLARLGDPGLVPEIYGDLNFRMLGAPVDEAAVLATFDVHLAPNPADPTDTTRYFVTFLVNSQELDPLGYEQGFLRSWAKELGEPGLRRLRERTYCGIYAIGGPTLLAKLLTSKAKPCAAERVRYQDGHPERYPSAERPDGWFLPVAFTDASGSR